MELVLKRTRFRDTITTGQLYVDGQFFCFTLEDKVREVPNVPVETWKIHGETAIPSGIYEVFLENSPKFGPDTMTLRDVPGFSKIRIHSGNTQDDTEGCIIIGYRVIENGIIVPGTTRPAVTDLKRLVRSSNGCKIKIFN